ncbi:alpha-amylase/4-alpha-glucanotransferase domain-containing protein [Alienimonas sp. DA493]|uniref:alpha-amylase/4-alpha-glucanotransferase domain-containing protein n=1 Tax=Alienimonas sp. DA493 TaxID=3373605 RepID=UPI0037547C77
MSQPSPPYPSSFGHGTPGPGAFPVGSPRLRLILCLHDHQPVGNFDGVFAAAFRDSYEPFLDEFEPFESLRIALHISGSLLEWLEMNRPAYLRRVRDLVEAGRVEILGGPFYEPILAGIPRRDRVGQMTRYSHHLKSLFGQPVRGMWLPERVWEQQFAGDIAKAGLEYCVLDDGHLRAAGLRDEDLNGHFLTEDDGRLIALFPGDEHLRYLMPFRPPQETINYLKHIAAAREAAGAPQGTAVVFGDDGEKFGTWPGTKKAVYERGWLRKFFEALVENGDWLQTSTFSETLDAVPPAGEVSVPDCSYREMTEWALNTQRQTELHDLVEAKTPEADWSALKPYIRGGNWRNFRTKYPEAREMYARMTEVSARLDAFAQTAEGFDKAKLDKARTHLYKAQCNCPYWHGAFGGLYLPHLRNAVYDHLISADSILDELEGRTGRWCAVAAKDYDLDARKEVRLAGDKLIAYLKPSRGGICYELDVRGAGHNLLATLDRRPEPYHARILAHAANPQIAAAAHDGEESVSIHDLVHFKQPNLEQKLGYDLYPTKAFVDHFLEPGLTREEFRAGRGELSDCPTGVFETTLKRSAAAATVMMSRTARLARFAVRMHKTITLAAGSNALSVRYQFSGLPAGRPVHFATAVHLAGLAGSAEDRYFYDAHGVRRGTLDTALNLPATNRVGLCDEWLGLDAALELGTASSGGPGGIWTHPVETVSGSEAGFESVFQSCAVVPHWEFIVPADGRWAVDLTLTCDASAAQAQALEKGLTKDALRLRAA